MVQSRWHGQSCGCRASALRSDVPLQQALLLAVLLLARWVADYQEIVAVMPVQALPLLLTPRVKWR